MKILLLLLKLILKWKSHIWLPGYWKDRQEKANITIPKDKPIDIMFLIVDHYEPSRKDGEKSVQKVRKWCELYEEYAKKHQDSDGYFPQHTWFYRYDFPSYKNIRVLSEFVFKKFGEIEFHLHHGNDTAKNFRDTIYTGVEWFNQVGAMISAEANPNKRFAYVAGNWALDNGQKDPQFSGVNTEISILNHLGCYADYTFPAFGEVAQPRRVNSIYYATDTPEPKSYDCGIDLEVGKSPTGDLMIFQGPLFIDWSNAYTETAAYESYSKYLSRRINCWQKAHVHVKGRPEWTFIKLHTHGMQSRDIFLSDNFNEMCNDLEDRFKKPPYRLHYVTAREAYNIVKAAESGKVGNPKNYRNYCIKEPINRKINCNQPYNIQKYTPNYIQLKIDNISDNIKIYFKESPVELIKGGKINNIEISYSNESLLELSLQGEGMSQIVSNIKIPGIVDDKIELPFQFRR